MKSFATRPMILRYKGLFDFQAVYNQIHEWLEHQIFTFQEHKYKSKPKSPWGFEHEVKFRGKRKLDGYFAYEIKFFVQTTECTEVEIDGKRLFNGRLKIEFDGAVITDYSKRFEGNKFFKSLEKLYNFMIKREIELTMWDSFHYTLHQLQEDLKKTLNMYADTNYFRK